MNKKMTKTWYKEGVHAGKTDGWMNLEETLPEDHESWPEVKDYEELVRRGMDEWEDTDHFRLIYGSKIMGDAEEATGMETGTLINDETFEKYSEFKDEFWEGYLAGRKSIGRDIYAMAKKLVSGKGSGKGKVQRVRKKVAKALSAVRGIG